MKDIGNASLNGPHSFRVYWNQKGIYIPYISSVHQFIIKRYAWKLYLSKCYNEDYMFLELSQNKIRIWMDDKCGAWYIIKSRVYIQKLSQALVKKTNS